MAREYFCAYHSYLDSMKRLTDEERGRLFTACLEYSMTGVEPELSGNEVFVWDGIRSQIDRDKEAYVQRCKSQSDNANKRWKSGYTDNNLSMPTHANACQAMPNMPTHAKHAKEKEKEKEKENEKENEKDKENNTTIGADKPRKAESTDELEIAIGYFKEHRKAISKKMTDHAVDLLRKRLEELAPNDKQGQIDLIDLAISKGWMNVYLPDEQVKAKRSAQSKVPTYKLTNEEETSNPFKKKLQEELRKQDEQNRNHADIVDIESGVPDVLQGLEG